MSAGRIRAAGLFRRWPGLLVVALTGPLLWLPAAARTDTAVLAGADGPSFHVEEILSHPRADGVSLSMVPAEAVEAYVRYGELGVLERSTPLLAAGAGALLAFDLGALEVSGTYGFQVHVRRAGERVFQLRAPGGFRTLAAPGDPVTFGVIADTHAYAVWSQDAPGTEYKGFEKLQGTIANVIADESLDFAVLGGDIAMTHCGGGCLPKDVDGVTVGPGTVDSQQEADLRYRATLSPKILGPLGRALPLALVLGNHDGEAGFGDADGTCSQFDTTADYSRHARLAHLPNASDSYDGNRVGSAYTFRTGDVQIVVLDVMRYNPAMPLGPDQWTLGSGQLEWLEQTLRGSDAPFKFVFGEHLLGGASDPAHCYWYGRGGLRATDTGEVDGSFVGEQALVHEILRRHGAQLFLSFHDHVVVAGEKIAPDGSPSGVHYVIGGQSSGNQPPWTTEAWYQQQMDYDGDGVAEFETDTTGTRKKGWFRVTVDGAAATLEYVLTKIDDPTLDGTVLLSYTIAR